MSEPRVALLVHGGPESVEAARARGLTRNHPPDKVHFLLREGTRANTARDWQRQLRLLKPDLLYVLNTALPGAPLACWWRLLRAVPFVLDTGDVIYEMARRSGITPFWKRPALWFVETAAQRLAHNVVVRGARHEEYLLSRGCPRVALIRDGFHEDAPVDPTRVEELRRQLGLESKFVVGVLGSLIFSPRLKICYGWDLIEALALLAELPAHGLIIGDGDGRAWLEARAHQLGVSDRVTFLGRIPFASVPEHLRLFDLALSTQTNNLPGQVRTTGKLPEYMAAERFILASRVGDAAALLPESMLVDYAGEVDANYPQKLAERVRALWHDRAAMELRHSLRAVAEEHCSYEVLSRKFDAVISGVAAGGRQERK
jgi:glycosyltransferase involved in cell wall biosynthesis